MEENGIIAEASCETQRRIGICPVVAPPLNLRWPSVKTMMSCDSRSDKYIQSRRQVGLI